MPNKVKYGIKVPNSVRKALILDKENNNTLWADAIKKEMTALNKANCFEYFPLHHRFGKDYQYTPLRIIFDVKKEDLRRKARLVAGGHVVDFSMYESYSSVVQSRTLRILQTIAANENMRVITSHVGNTFIQAFTKEKNIF